MCKVISLLFCLVFLAGCSSTITTKHVPPRIDDQKRHLFIFLDGTNNDATSRTNVAKLHNLVSLQRHPEIASLYVDGVGTGRTGMAQITVHLLNADKMLTIS